LRKNVQTKSAKFGKERRLGFNGDLKLLRAHLEVEAFSFDFDGGAAEVERDGQASVLAQLHVFGDVDHELAFPADAISDDVPGVAVLGAVKLQLYGGLVIFDGLEPAAEAVVFLHSVAFADVNLEPFVAHPNPVVELPQRGGVDPVLEGLHGVDPVGLLTDTRVDGVRV
jgi:hypothetical protein